MSIKQLGFVHDGTGSVQKQVCVSKMNLCEYALCRFLFVFGVLLQRMKSSSQKKAEKIGCGMDVYRLFLLKRLFFRTD